MIQDLSQLFMVCLQSRWSKWGIRTDASQKFSKTEINHLDTVSYFLLFNEDLRQISFSLLGNMIQTNYLWKSANLLKIKSTCLCHWRLFNSNRNRKLQTLPQCFFWHLLEHKIVNYSSQNKSLKNLRTMTKSFWRQFAFKEKCRMNDKRILFQAKVAKEALLCQI